MTAEFEYVKVIYFYYLNLHNSFPEKLALGPQFLHSKQKIAFALSSWCCRVHNKIMLKKVFLRFTLKIHTNFNRGQCLISKTLA